MDRHHIWRETSDPFTPQCSVCLVREGDIRDSLPCPGEPYPEYLPAPRQHWLARLVRFFFGP